MPSGYEKSPDYGGKPPGPYEWVWYVLAMAGIVVVLIWVQT